MKQTLTPQNSALYRVDLKSDCSDESGSPRRLALPICFATRCDAFFDRRVLAADQATALREPGGCGGAIAANSRAPFSSSKENPTVKSGSVRQMHTSFCEVVR
jgi:hypothetical protein